MTSEEIVKHLKAFRESVYAEHIYNEAATLIEAQTKEIADLKTKLAYAEDAAAKGDLARQTAGGMEMEIAELRNSLSLAISKFPEIANSVADFANRQRSQNSACGD